MLKHGHQVTLGTRNPRKKEAQDWLKANSGGGISAIVEQLGWEPFDCGGIIAARAIEPLCMLWCIPGFLRNHWNQAFKLLTPPADVGQTPALRPAPRPGSGDSTRSTTD